MAAQREYSSVPIVGVGAVVIESGRVLLVRRGQEPFMGQWSVPGGAVELGETLEDAIVREVREETGLTVTPAAMLKVLNRIESDAAGRIRFHYVLIDFLCRAGPAQGTLHAATDVSDARWFPLEMLRQTTEFILPAWTLEVIEEGRRRVQGETSAFSY